MVASSAGVKEKERVHLLLTSVYPQVKKNTQYI